MQVDRLLARLSIAASSLALVLGVAPALAQDGVESVAAEPLPMFNAACLSGSARLSRKMATDTAFTVLPDPARRALGKVLPKLQADAVKADTLQAAQIPNRILQIAGGQLYLITPGAKATVTPSLAESCIVLWQSTGQDDYLQARKVVMPNEAKVPMYFRPSSNPEGFVFATSVSGGNRLTMATYGGWIALRSSSDNPTPPADPQKVN